MEGFKSFTQAVDLAAGSCSSWRSAEDGSIFSYLDLMGTAIVMDTAAPLDEPFWYAVFPDGEIDYLCTETKLIDRLFYPVNSIPVPKSELIGFGDESEIPDDILTDRPDGSFVKSSPKARSDAEKANGGSGLASSGSAAASSDRSAAASADERMRPYKFCKYCGSRIDADAVFCSACGKKL